MRPCQLVSVPRYSYTIIYADLKFTRMCSRSLSIARIVSSAAGGKEQLLLPLQLLGAEAALLHARRLALALALLRIVLLEDGLDVARVLFEAEVLVARARELTVSSLAAACLEAPRLTSSAVTTCSGAIVFFWPFSQTSFASDDTNRMNSVGIARAFVSHCFTRCGSIEHSPMQHSMRTSRVSLVKVTSFGSTSVGCQTSRQPCANLSDENFPHAPLMIFCTVARGRESSSSGGAPPANVSSSDIATPISILGAILSLVDRPAYMRRPTPPPFDDVTISNGASLTGRRLGDSTLLTE